MSTSTFTLKDLKSELTTRLNIGAPYTVRSYSQEGEDILLRKLFDGQTNGFYVDVGAHHPFRYSNTQYFYEKGWRGINIDATPGSLLPFSRVRHRDINIEALVGNDDAEVTYHLFEDPALNTSSKELAQAVEDAGQSREIKQLRLETHRLATILDRHLPSAVKIDFLTVDVEGGELEVLKSNDWDRYRPTVLLVEALSALSLKEVFESELVTFLQRKKYELFGRALNTLYFREKK
jgi:FkbM family methyltransferase